MKSAEQYELSLSEHEEAIVQHYEDSQTFYDRYWHPDHLHFPLFEEGRTPRGKRDSSDPILVEGMHRMIDTVVAPSNIQAHHHVVDAGCGVGGTAIHLANTRGCTVTGLDISKHRLQRAAEKAAQAGLTERVNFKIANCSQSLPLADASVDVVVALENVCYYDDLAQFLREVSRILKPGGYIVVEDFATRADLNSPEYQKYVHPFCETWLLSSIESPFTWNKKLHDAGLELLEYTGFPGLDEQVLKNIMSNRDYLSALQLLRLSDPDTDAALRMFDGAYTGLKQGWWRVIRFCAQKPAF